MQVTLETEVAEALEVVEPMVEQVALEVVETTVVPQVLQDQI